MKGGRIATVMCSKPRKCLLSFGSSSGPPSLPVLCDNFKQIVQTKDYVLIPYGIVHDARIISFDRPHAPRHMGKWFGDPVAHWEGRHARH